MPAPYGLGLDLGTTFTAAATWQHEQARICQLGTHSAAIPSVLLLRDDDSLIVGEAAARRALSDPTRVAREIKRRFGDSTPVLLGDSPMSVEALTARLVRSVVADVARRQGGDPAAVCVTYPANWGQFRLELLRSTIRMADLKAPVEFVTEPEAAAINFAHEQRLDPGEVVAVYDLGGGTFDAAVLRRTADGFELLGEPEGIERLGGLDVDAAVYNHVLHVLRSRVEPGPALEPDEDDPTWTTGIAHLRQQCTAAKEGLSADTDVDIPVFLPGCSTEVRLTRYELERMIRPALHDSVDALRRAIRSADVAADDLTAVLLVGGSSRIPLVGELVTAALGRPVAVDVHPKHGVALGAAWLAGRRLATTAGQKIRPSDAAATGSNLHPTAAAVAVAGPDTVTSSEAEPSPSEPVVTVDAGTGEVHDSDVETVAPVVGSSRTDDVRPSPVPSSPAPLTAFDRLRAFPAWIVAAGAALLLIALVAFLLRSAGGGVSSARQTSTLTGHTGTVFSVAWSPDGRTLATAGDDSTVRLWDSTTNTQAGLLVTGHTGAVFSVAWSPDGKTLATASSDRTVRLWNPSTDAQTGLPLTGHAGAVFSVAWSPDGKTLATASSDRTVRLWNPSTDTQNGDALTGHTGWVRRTAWSPDGKTLATAGDDGTVRLWNPSTHTQIGRPLTGHTNGVTSVAWSPDGKTLATASTDGTVRLWNPSTHTQIGRPLTGHTNGVTSVAWSPDGKTLATASTDRTVSLWSVE